MTTTTTETLIARATAAATISAVTTRDHSSHGLVVVLECQDVESVEDVQDEAEAMYAAGFACVDSGAADPGAWSYWRPIAC